MKFLPTFAVILSLAAPAAAATRNWTNTLGGNWFTPANWSPNVVPLPNDVANITSAGTYTITISTGTVAVANLTLGAASGTQTLIHGTTTVLSITNAGTVAANGVLIITNSGLQGQLTVQPAGQLQFNGLAAKGLYNLVLINQGTVTWSGGQLFGGSTFSTIISNGGLWQMTGDDSMQLGISGPPMMWTNSGTFRKSAGTGTSQISSFNFFNQPGGLVDAQSGTLAITGGTTNILGGTCNASGSGLFSISGGTWTDAGGVATGAGTNRFNAGTLNLRTNLIAGLKLTGGDVYVTGTNTFQQAGAITNLTLDGSLLRGTNKIGAGLVTINAGGVDGQLTIQPAGQLLFATAASKSLYNLVLVNQGTVSWAAGGLFVGSTFSTIISNGGLWQMTSDDTIQLGIAGPQVVWTNSGTLRKSGGAGTSQIFSFDFRNQPGGLVDAQSGTITFSGGPNNVLGGTLNSSGVGLVNITAGTWTDAGGVATGAGINRFNGGTLNLRTNLIAGLKLTAGDVYVTGTNTFQQAGAITNLTLDGSLLRGTNKIGSGLVTINAGGVDGQLTIQPAGQLLFATAASKSLYNLMLFNQGTVNWTAGGLFVGSTFSTIISNGGLWQMTSDDTIQLGIAGPQVVWTNSGTLRKTAGSGTSQIFSFNFFNQPGGLVDAQSGTIAFSGGPDNVLGGTLNSSGVGLVNITAGTWTDAGGVATGAGINRFNGGTLNLRTNFIAGLKLTAGDVYVTGTNTFQQAGAITNLTLDGSLLRGTNKIGAGLVTINAGGVDGQLTIQPAGQLLFATTASKSLYNLVLFNQGTVTWATGGLFVGSTFSTIISNGGLWQITSDDTIQLGIGGPQVVWTNSGTLRKTAGSGTSQISAFNLYNQPTGLIQSDTGTLQLPTGFTNTSGTLRLNGGTLSAGGTLGFTGGTLDGDGTLGVNALTGGNITPGQGGPGILRFNSGLNLSTNATVILSGTGTIARAQYDQLSVTGAVALANATLQVTALPAVVGGTTFVLILNDGADAVSGTFNGLPENAPLSVGGQPFHIHYAGGSGNDVTLVRDGSPPGPQLLTTGGLTNGVWRFSGTGTPSAIYTIQATTNFILWSNIGFATGNVSGNFSFPDTNAFRFQYRFYRTTN